MSRHPAAAPAAVAAEAVAPTPAAPPGPVDALVELDPAQQAAVLALAGRAGEVDGGEPLSEDARLALRAPGRPGLRHLLVPHGAGIAADGPAGGGLAGGGLAGYAQVAGSAPQRPGAVLELLVDPGARGGGLGSALAAAAEAVAADVAPGPLGAWSHADSPAAAALAARRGWVRVRDLWRMERPLGPGAPALAPLELPDDVRLRPFEVGRDEHAWLAVNARAFAAHPEQGRWGPDDLAARKDEPWFDPAGLLLAVDASDGHLLASHWTKRQGAAGEVYVVAVDPPAQGRGLGRAVVLAGLHHLQASGVRRVDLYVEGANPSAQRLYTRLGFARTGVDAYYERP